MVLVELEKKEIVEKEDSKERLKGAEMSKEEIERICSTAGKEMAKLGVEPTEEELKEMAIRVLKEFQGIYEGFGPLNNFKKFYGI